MEDSDLPLRERTADQTDRRPWLTTRAIYAACAWALLFTVPHIYWAVGGTAGLAGHPMTGRLWVINVVAIPLLLLAVVVALATVRPWGRVVPRWLLLLSIWGVGVVLTLRGTIGLVQRILSFGDIGHQPFLALFADPWFVLGGVLFSVVAWDYTRRLQHGRDGTP
ncbi:DUF3995 domain-containing protein [Natrinema gelatinilyticum]|uniref:DUF3995 domain-containing protein n=1 Tax=Natrinema gelatinilyticum TaxID=2961571 RepID=UPI003CE45B73